MDVFKKYNFGKVQGYELGSGLIGPPMMTAYFYIVDGIMIDTGQSNMRKKFSEIIKNKKINTAILTHYHEDHSGNVSVVKKLLDIPVYGHALTKNKLSKKDNIHIYQKIIWGESDIVDIDLLPDCIESEKYSFVPIHTPGHSKDHTVFWEKNMGWLFSGDLYLGAKIKFFRSDENMLETIKSLKKILELDFDSLFCAHNPRVKNGKTALKEKHGFLENFFEQVISLRKKGYRAKEIKKQLKLKENKLIRCITLGNVSLLNMIKSSIKSAD